MNKIVRLTKWREEALLRAVVQEVAEQEGKEVLQRMQSLRELGPSEMALRRFAKELDAYFLQQHAVAYKRKVSWLSSAKPRRDGNDTE